MGDSLRKRAAIKKLLSNHKKLSEEMELNLSQAGKDDGDLDPRWMWVASFLLGAMASALIALQFFT